MTFKEIRDLVDEEVGSRPEAVFDFIQALKYAADETAQHAEHDWQDETLAAGWTRIARYVDECEARIYQLHLF